MNTNLTAQRIAEAKACLAGFRREDEAFMNDETNTVTSPNYGQWAGRLANRLEDLLAIVADLAATLSVARDALPRTPETGA